MLALYSYEGSPFCRLGRETLCELEIPYRLHNIAKGSAKRIVSVIPVDNAASVRVAERLGERFDRNLQVGGFPCALHAIDRNQWKG